MNGDPRAVPAPCGQSWTRGAEAGAHTHPGSPAQLLHVRRFEAIQGPRCPAAPGYRVGVQKICVTPL